jgi:hypothetical protein
MAIKNKDGTIFQLQKPNPIMKDQEFWDDYILHNFNGETAAIERPKKKYQNIEEIEPQEIKVPIKETPIEKPKKKEEPNKEEPTKTLLYCMPATITIKHDKLYGEDRVIPGYGTQFTLESIIIEMDDLTCRLWVNTDKVTENSILYIPKTIRWWKVEKITDDNNGYVIVCMPSPIQPSFSN